jgi:hypothetical protein
MAAEAQKEPGKLKQMWRVLQMTRRGDKWIVPILLISFLGPLALGIILPFTVLPGGIFTKILWITTGVLGGLLLALVILGNRAEAVAYRQISGQPGAVGAILQGSLRRAWQTSEFPVQVNPRTQDAVYRAVGKCGVVLIAEGPKTRVKKILDDEKKMVARAVPQVPIHIVHVGPDNDSTALPKLRKTLYKFKKELNKAEVLAVSHRLSSLKKPGTIPMPKGIDPFKMRAPKPR